MAYEDYKNEEGQGERPSIETRYDAASAPGLFQNLKYIRSQGTAAIDWRTSPGYSRKGGYYGVTLHDFADRDKTYSFRRLDGEIIQHLPILRENWVLSFRGRVQTTLDDDDNVPVLPAAVAREREHAARVLDGALPRSARTADDGRVPLDSEPPRARHGALLRRRQGEPPVASDLDFNGLKTDWGIGARFHGPTATPIRLEMARGSEGWRLVISSSAAF